VRLSRDSLLSLTDLKPDNIFIDDNNNALVGDFGLACHYDKTEPRVLARPGTLHYSAPETFARHLHSFGFDAQSYFGAMGIEVDPTSHCAILNGPELDVWGLGVVLYVTITRSLSLSLSLSVGVPCADVFSRGVCSCVCTSRT